MAIDAPSAAPGAATPAQTARQKSLYRAVWRWHFYAGLFAIPVIVLLSVTGIIYLFKPQLNDLMYGDAMNVTPAVAGQVLRGAEAGGPARLPGLLRRRPAHPGRAWTRRPSSRSPRPTASRSRSGSTRTPARSPAPRAQNNILQISKELHGTLVTGDFLTGKFAKYGDAFIEIIAGWTIVMLVTGLYLW